MEDKPMLLSLEKGQIRYIFLENDLTDNRNVPVEFTLQSRDIDQNSQLSEKHYAQGDIEILVGTADLTNSVSDLPTPHKAKHIYPLTKYRQSQTLQKHQSDKEFNRSWVIGIVYYESVDNEYYDLGIRVTVPYYSDKPNQPVAIYVFVCIGFATLFVFLVMCFLKNLLEMRRNQQLEAAIQREETEGSDLVGLGAEPEVLFPCTLFQELLTQQSECSVCLDTFEKGSKVRRLRCKHVFHRDCIDLWFERNIFCPLCKRDCSINGPEVNTTFEDSIATVNTTANLLDTDMDDSRDDLNISSADNHSGTSKNSSGVRGGGLPFSRRETSDTSTTVSRHNSLQEDHITAATQSNNGNQRPQPITRSSLDGIRENEEDDHSDVEDGNGVEVIAFGASGEHRKSDSITKSEAKKASRSNEREEAKTEEERLSPGRKNAGKHRLQGVIPAVREVGSKSKGEYSSIAFRSGKNYPSKFEVLVAQSAVLQEGEERRNSPLKKSKKHSERKEGAGMVEGLPGIFSGIRSEDKSYERLGFVSHNPDIGTLSDTEDSSQERTKSRDVDPSGSFSGIVPVSTTVKRSKEPSPFSAVVSSSLERREDREGRESRDERSTPSRTRVNNGSVTTSKRASMPRLEPSRPSILYNGSSEQKWAVESRTLATNITKDGGGSRRRSELSPLPRNSSVSGRQSSFLDAGRTITQNRGYSEEGSLHVDRLTLSDYPSAAQSNNSSIHVSTPSTAQNDSNSEGTSNKSRFSFINRPR
eukprot:CAMPEP_0114972572 /NCGR_PEP_ID=MMETSP0216-20121206/472_1 /TAXON_ID=223996 /ORGANISM="Protocruzia adherens, Strain Boccale" /LENGTH=754 /DNA_ID=CAMNT_0002332965 /DNA_START=269 /DNA_END=2534 /DNA_ORIENTATION=+